MNTDKTTETRFNKVKKDISHKITKYCYQISYNILDVL